MPNSYTIKMGDLREQMEATLRKRNNKLTEKVLLKVPGAEPANSMSEPSNIPMPPAPPIGQDENIPSNDEVDAKVSQPKFDAGVEADPDTDPKKYIQQLTGKLSTELQKYVKDVPNDAVEISKYVMGMLASQAGKSLDDAGKNEIIKKLNNAKENADAAESDDNNNQPQEPDEDSVGQTSEQNQDDMVESIIRETLADMVDNEEENNEREDKVNRTQTTNVNRPYKPKF